MKKVMGLIGFGCLLLFTSTTFAGIEEDKAFNEKKILTVEEMRAITGGGVETCDGKECNEPDCSYGCWSAGGFYHICEDDYRGYELKDKQGRRANYSGTTQCGIQYVYTYVSLPCFGSRQVEENYCTKKGTYHKYCTDVEM